LVHSRSPNNPQNSHAVVEASAAASLLEIASSRSSLPSQLPTTPPGDAQRASPPADGRQQTNAVGPGTSALAGGQPADSDVAQSLAALASAPNYTNQRTFAEHQPPTGHRVSPPQQMTPSQTSHLYQPGYQQQPAPIMDYRSMPMSSHYQPGGEDGYRPQFGSQLPYHPLSGSYPNQSCPPPQPMYPPQQHQQREPMQNGYSPMGPQQYMPQSIGGYYGPPPGYRDDREAYYQQPPQQHPGYQRPPEQYQRPPEEPYYPGPPRSQPQPVYQGQAMYPGPPPPQQHQAHQPQQARTQAHPHARERSPRLSPVEDLETNGIAMPLRTSCEACRSGRWARVLEIFEVGVLTMPCFALPDEDATETPPAHAASSNASRASAPSAKKPVPKAPGNAKPRVTRQRTRPTARFKPRRYNVRTGLLLASRMGRLGDIPSR